MRCTSRSFRFRALSAQSWLDEFRSYYGPMLKTFAALSPEDQQRLSDDLLALCADHNASGDSTMVVPSEYLEVIIRKA